MNSNEWELGVVLRFKGSRDNDLGEVKFGVRSTREELWQSDKLRRDLTGMVWLMGHDKESLAIMIMVYGLTVINHS